MSSRVAIKTQSSMLAVSAQVSRWTPIHITNGMQRGAAEKIGSVMGLATAKLMPEAPDLPEETELYAMVRL